MPPFFFFGTLRDRDVLGRVLARPVRQAELRPAILHDHRCVAVDNAVYPVLRHAVGTTVDGCLFQPLEVWERRRIDHFESHEYAAAEIRVEVGGVAVVAMCYRPLPGVFVTSHRPWDLAGWQRRHKARYLPMCDGWMADFALTLDER